MGLRTFFGSYLYSKSAPAALSAFTSGSYAQQTPVASSGLNAGRRPKSTGAPLTVTA